VPHAAEGPATKERPFVAGHSGTGELTDGGEEVQCGRLKDRYGLSWQVCTPRMGELLGGSDPERAASAMRAMFGTKKLDLVALQAAADAA